MTHNMMPPPTAQRRTSAQGALTKGFTRVLRGYSTAEVDAFLKACADTITYEQERADAAHEKVRELQARHAAAGADSAHASVPEQTLRMLAAAQQQIDRWIAESARGCRDREQQALERYDAVLADADNYRQQVYREALAAAERDAQAYRQQAGPGYTSDGEQLRRTRAMLRTLMNHMRGLSASNDAVIALAETLLADTPPDDDQPDQVEQVESGAEPATQPA